VVGFERVVRVLLGDMADRNVNGLSELNDRPMQIDPPAADLDGGFVEEPTTPRRFAQRKQRR
jgi:hypothetical protein